VGELDESRVRPLVAGLQGQHGEAELAVGKRKVEDVHATHLTRQGCALGASGVDSTYMSQLTLSIS
jgi:hypothetical protein